MRIKRSGMKQNNDIPDKIMERIRKLMRLCGWRNRPYRISGRLIGRLIHSGHNKLQEDGQLYKSPFLERIR